MMKLIPLDVNFDTAYEVFDYSFLGEFGTCPKCQKATSATEYGGTIYLWCWRCRKYAMEEEKFEQAELREKIIPWK